MPATTPPTPSSQTGAGSGGAGDVGPATTTGGPTARPPPPPPPPPLPRPPPPPAGITFAPITPGPVLDQLKALNAALFPVNYQAQFYRDALSAGDLTHGAFVGPALVGAIAVRLERLPVVERGAPAADDGGGEVCARMYVMTVGVAAPHRGEGLGTALLTRALSAAAEDPAIGSAYLHVHVSNTDAIAFYERLGFTRGQTVPGYYRKLSPPDAVVLERRLR